MTMIVREMILLDQDCYEQTHPLEFSDDSGWLGPPRAVPFAWELAPGTPKQDRTSTGKSSHSVSPSPEAKSLDSSLDCDGVHLMENKCTAIVKVEPGMHDEFLDSGRHSIHILETAPRSFLASRNSEVSTGLYLFNEGAVPFKWEMEPGIPRDPDKCRTILDCPLTPPPVLHSKSMVVHSSNRSSIRSPRHQISLTDRMKSLLWIHPHRPKQHDFLLRAAPAKKSSKILLLKDSSDSYSPRNSRSPSLKKGGEAHSDEEDLSPVSVLDYNSSVRYVNDQPGSNRLSSASSSVRSSYHTPKHSFSWDNTASSPALSRTLSSNRSLKSVAGKEPRKNSLYSLITLKRFTGSKQSPGCFMAFSKGQRSSSFTGSSLYEEAASEFTSSEEKSSCLSDSSSEHAGGKEVVKEILKGNTSDEDGQEGQESVYHSPAPKLRCDSFSFQQDKEGQAEMTSVEEREGGAEFKGFDILERIDSLDTIDPGFAPSEMEDDGYQQDLNILNRMASCARWQKRQASTKSRRSASQLARNLFGRVGVCCYVPRDPGHHE